jgi:hypothetical protein
MFQITLTELELVTKLLHRIRYLADQIPFDATTFVYIIPLLLLVFRSGGIDRHSIEDRDEQIVLAVEIISLHTDICESSLLIIEYY